MFSIPCKTGKIQLTDDGMLQIVQAFGKILWQAHASTIVGLTTQPGAMMALNVTIQTNQGTHYLAEMVTKANFEKLQAVFPHLQAQAAGKEWYHSPTALTHMAVYTNQKQMQREVEIAGQFGWIPQTSAGVAGHINVGRTTTAAVLTGGASLLFGASRSKDKITITFVRSPQWLAAHQR